MVYVILFTWGITCNWGITCIGVILVTNHQELKVFLIQDISVYTHKKSNYITLQVAISLASTQLAENNNNSLRETTGGRAVAIGLMCLSLD